MLVAVISDTHGVENILKKIKDYINHVDILIHLGDNIIDLEYLKNGFKGKVYGVKGNCDFLSNELEEQVIQISGKKFLITHGDKYGVKYNLTSIFFKCKELSVDVALFGHTHCKLITEEQGIWLINPGSPSLPKDNIGSIAFIEIKEGKINAYTQNI